MKIWVTGEAGCLARNLADYCNVRSDYEVVNRLSESYYDYWRMAITSPTKEINIFDPSLPRLIEDSGADVIVHAAAINYDVTQKDPHLAIHTNIEGTFRMGEIAKKLDIPIIYISETYFDSKYKNIYATTKDCGEQMLSQAKASYNVIIPTNIYGKYDFTSYIAKMILSTKGNQAKLPADVSRLREFIHTSEVIQVIEFAIDEELYDPYGVRGTFSTTTTNLDEVYTELCSMVPYPLDCAFNADDDYYGQETTGYFYDYSNDSAVCTKDIIKNRIIMKDAINDMIKDLL